MKQSRNRGNSQHDSFIQAAGEFNSNTFVLSRAIATCAKHSRALSGRPPLDSAAHSLRYSSLPGDNNHAGTQGSCQCPSPQRCHRHMLLRHCLRSHGCGNQIPLALAVRHQPMQQLHHGQKHNIKLQHQRKRDGAVISPVSGLVPLKKRRRLVGPAPRRH